jgi:hypothetical protein
MNQPGLHESKVLQDTINIVRQISLPIITENTVQISASTLIRLKSKTIYSTPLYSFSFESFPEIFYALIYILYIILQILSLESHYISWLLKY